MIEDFTRTLMAKLNANQHGTAELAFFGANLFVQLWVIHLSRGRMGRLPRSKYPSYL
ncbi:MAG: hypothetical protein PWP23_3136 [Candidatus Sumerlaeota bacterium]|nr:hypothetical protein [Candidatus Sumerlaeota bacterium]